MKDENRSGKTLTRRNLITRAAIAISGITGVAGCIGGDAEDNNQVSDTPLPIETDTPTETPAQTENPKAKFPLSYEQIVENNYVQEQKKWQLSPIRAENYKKNFDNTSILITETIRRTRKNERQDPKQDLSDNEMVPHYRTYIHGEEFLNFSHDEITMSYRENEVGTAVMRVWDHTGNETQRYLIAPDPYDKDGRDEMILREGEKPDLSSTTQAGLAGYRDGENNSAVDSPFEVEDFRTKPSEKSKMTQQERIESAVGMGRSQAEFYQEVFDYTEFEGPSGEMIDASEVDITFGWNTAEFTVDLEKSEDFFTTGTEYVHNTAALSDTQNMLIGVEEDFNEYSEEHYSTENMETITEIKGEEILATTVDDELYKQARDELFMSKEERKAYN